MNKNQQAAYRAMQQGLTNLSDEFQIPRLEGKDLSNVFFEIFLVLCDFTGIFNHFNLSAHFLMLHIKFLFVQFI